MGFGIVCLEAAAAGGPQGAGNSGGAAEAVVHGDTGLVVDDPSDVDEVVEALERLLLDDTLRSSMSHRGRARAVADFDYEHLAPRLLAAIEGP